ncbi:helix-turn-helix domain-containing protein [Sphingomonas sp. RB3P16]|uniref:helix-turn-helix domain-containing protein n=1 Tax=Parasphingomonas frigoris TaxID=3096163 RepID=UPI002FCC971B
MTEPTPAEEATLFPKSSGDKLREAREALGLTLAEVAARTRIPGRQLEAIEQGNYAALPSITYSVGFAKAYARAVGLDEVAIARDVRSASDQPSARRTDYQAYEIDEPARVPPRGLVLGAVVVAVLLLIGVGLFYGTSLFRGDGEPAPASFVAIEAPKAPVAAPTPSAPTGAVVLSATDEVWLKVYQKAADGTSKTLYIGTLKAGERYPVPADATAPLINVGRPDKLTVTVGGTPVAPLGDGRIAIKDVPIDAATLTARGGAAPVATPTTAAAPSERRPESRGTPRARASSSIAPLNIAAPAAVAPEPEAPAATPAP